MKNISVLLLGTPHVELNGESVHFRYKKAEALFYYIAVKKMLTREEILRVFWADQEERAARDRLRDVLYSIKKVLGDDAVLTVGNSLVKLSPSLPIEIDVDRITPENIVEKYRGDFLDCFFIKNCYEFEEWADEQRGRYRGQYLEAFHRRIHSRAPALRTGDLGKYADLVMRNDAYDERSLREIMELYAAAGLHNDAIQLYNRLCTTLKKDLGEQPEAETQKLCARILEMRKQQSTPRSANMDYFYGRDKELLRTTAWMDDLSLGKGGSLLLLGEAGVGKTSLIQETRRHTDSSRFIILMRCCYKAERDLHLKPWYDILTQVNSYLEHQAGENVSHKRVLELLFPCLGDSTKGMLSADDAWLGLTTEAVFSTLAECFRGKKIILIFDDIQWMDSASKRLLTNILLKQGNRNIGLLAACRDDCEESIADFMLALESSELLTMLRIERFDMRETAEILRECMPGLDKKGHTVRKIYQDTEGNALFLMELMKLMKEKGYTDQLSIKVTNVIRSRLLDLSPGEKKLLNALSMFFDSATIEELKICTQDSELTLCENLEALLARRLIKEEIISSEILYSFTHQKIHDYVHKSQSAGTRRMMHRLIAEYYELLYTQKPDFGLSPKLIYHFSQSEDHYKTYVFKVEYLMEFYSVYHETYPYVSHDIASISSMEGEMAGSELLSLAQEIHALAPNVLDNQILMMKIDYILGRYHIREGDYINGLACIQRSIEYAQALGDTICLLGNYKQMIYYSIQLQNLDIMEHYISLAVETVQALPENHTEHSTIMRLKGLYLLKIRHYQEAEEAIWKTVELINRFCMHLPSYQMSLAVCYNYIGECRYFEKDYENAYVFFNRAVKTCEGQYAANGIGVFYCYMGQALYALGRYRESREAVTSANRCLDQFGALWGKPRAEAYAALLELKIGTLKEAGRHYELARRAARQLGNPEDIQLVDTVGEQLAAYKSPSAY